MVKTYGNPEPSPPNEVFQDEVLRGEGAETKAPTACGKVLWR